MRRSPNLFKWEPGPESYTLEAAWGLIYLGTIFFSPPRGGAGLGNIQGRSPSRLGTIFGVEKNVELISSTQRDKETRPARPSIATLLVSRPCKWVHG